MKFVDLHTHTTASDGSREPAEVVRMAYEAGLSAVAVTDHDTVAGLDEATAAGKKYRIEVIRGCELAVSTPPGEIHMLGLWIPEHAGELETALEELRGKRELRNQHIVRKLQELGCSINYDEVMEQAAGGTVGRPHIAFVLARKGYVADTAAAFREYLGYGGKAYFPKEVLSARDGLRLLREVGATPAFAHPCLYRWPLKDLEALVAELSKEGLLALEAYHSSHLEPDTRFVLGLARKYHLEITGGSDYHGDAKPEIQLGVGYGRLRVPGSVLTALKEQRVRMGLPV